MKDSSDRLVVVLLVIAVYFGTLAFYHTPAYEKGVWAIVGLLVAALTSILSFKFGVHVPKVTPPDNGTLKITTQTETAADTTVKSGDGV